MHLTIRPVTVIPPRPAGEGAVGGRRIVAAPVRPADEDKRWTDKNRVSNEALLNHTKNKN